MSNTDSWKTDHALRAKIETYLNVLCAADQYSEEREMSVFVGLREMECDSVTRCTTSAMHVARELGGFVCGYEIDYDKKFEKIIGYDCGGHDFAVVGHYLVDWWSKYVNLSGPAILDMMDPEDQIFIKQKYLPLPQAKGVPLWKIYKHQSNATD